MNLFLTILALLCIALLPALIIWLTRKNKVLGAIGAIVCCYLVGFAFSTIGFSGVDYDKGLTTTVAYVLVALSIPLILFSIDLRSLKKLTRETTVGFSLAIVAVVIVAVAMFFITLTFFPSARLSAMVVGLYTGGTPNLNAIGAALQADQATIAAANVSDTLVGGIYFLFLISLAPKVYEVLLRRRVRKASRADVGFDTKTVKETLAETAPAENISAEEAEVARGVPLTEAAKRDDYTFGFSVKDWRRVLRLAGVFFLAVGCLGVGALLEFLIEGTVGENLLYILLSVSLFGVAFSFIRPVRETEGQYALGMYLILMFSLALSMSIDWRAFLSDILPILGFFACAQLCTILVHLLLCRIFRVSGATALITSTAGVYGPPFIAPVAKAAKRADLIAPGVICGALGLAIGTLLGYGIGELLLLVPMP